jgi:hypothetical protein
MGEIRAFIEEDHLETWGTDFEGEINQLSVNVDDDADTGANDDAEGDDEPFMIDNEEDPDLAEARELDKDAEILQRLGNSVTNKAIVYAILKQNHPDDLSKLQIQQRWTARHNAVHAMKRQTEYFHPLPKDYTGNGLFLREDFHDSASPFHLGAIELPITAAAKYIYGSSIHIQPSSEDDDIHHEYDIVLPIIRIIGIGKNTAKSSISYADMKKTSFELSRKLYAE